MTCPAYTPNCTGNTVIRFEDRGFLTVALMCNTCDKTAIYEFVMVPE